MELEHYSRDRAACDLVPPSPRQGRAHEKEEQQQAAALLEAFFGKCLDPSDYFYDNILSQYDKETNDCIVRTSQHTSCILQTLAVRIAAHYHFF